MVGSAEGSSALFDERLDSVENLVNSSTFPTPQVLLPGLLRAFLKLTRRLGGHRLILHRAELARHFKKPVLWSRSPFVSSVGGANLETAKRYIEQQERPL